MTKLSSLLLATTALSALQFTAPPSHAQTTPLVVAQAREEVGPDGKPKQPPKEAPKEAPKAAPPARPAPPAAPPPAARPSPPPPPAAAPQHVPPPAAPTPSRPTPPPPPPAAAPPAAPKPPAGPAIQQEREREMEREKIAPSQRPPAGGATPTPAPTAPPPSPRTGPAPAAPTASPTAPPPPPRTGPAPAAPTPTPAPAAPSPRPAPAAPAPNAAPATPAPATPAPGAAPAAPGGQTALPPGGAPVARRPPPPTVTAPIPPPPPPAQAMTPVAPGAAPQGPRRLEDFRGQRQETDQGGRKVFTEPGRVIVVDPTGQSFIRHNEEDRFRFGARDIRTERVGGETRTVVIRPDGSQIINVVGGDGQLVRRIRRDREGREIIIIDNSYRDPRAVGGFYVDLPPPIIRIPFNRYIVEADVAAPELIYETLEAPPVDRIDRRYSLDEIRYSPTVRQLMPSIDLNTINFETGSWDIPPDQAARLQVIADGLNRAMARNPREVFLIEGHTDAVGNPVDNLSLSDRRAESAAELLTQQFGVPAENLTSQGYGAQYLKEQTDGPSRINRRVTVRRITPLLNGGAAALPPPPPGIAPPR
ncbi:MAG TPA: OmpA family protein [Bradyrhizobium sp.]|uniref:OmpA family protein n=1 Tax=Bradyrhizobium sp. TaxID=376 RepID=UPI002C824B35|nr:OmpA family protein [Bradyrhizobium sp.]HXB79094.1 OmpA family protein [Bradyrhizobium sp.]